jgi:meso-butanediol dehydrogenase / (S,S)-butanediol dehydrogenase / diacetyl reductase
MPIGKTDRVALVTGGSQGIGLAACRLLGRRGCRLAVLTRNAEATNAACRELANCGHETLPLVGDVAEESTFDDAIENVVDRWGGLDIMVNNAGTIAVEAVVDQSAESFDRVVSVNLRGTFLGCRAAARQMIEQGRGGRIINASSAAGRHGGALTAAYCASKAAVIGFTQSLAVELAPYGITVNAYCPGNVTSTAMWSAIDRAMVLSHGMEPGEAMSRFVEAQPIARSGTPEEVAAVIDFLASEDASFITGSAYSVDGGLARF